MSNEKDMYTVSEVATMKDITPHAVRAAIRRKKLSATKVGEIWIIFKSDAENYKPRKYITK